MALNDTYATATDGAYESSLSGMSWGAVLAGAVAASAVSLLLLFLGSALGFASVSPWPSANASATAITVGAAVWLIVMQWFSAAFGGYLTGRLRTKWVSLHTDEVFFRDTAHGFLTWAVATLFTAAFLASVTASIVSGGTQAATAVVAGNPQSANAMLENPVSYYVDRLYRTDLPGDKGTDRETRNETTRIIASGVKNDVLVDDDRAYLTRLVSARTGLSEDEAAVRVDEVVSQISQSKQSAKETADEARKAASKTAIFLCISMLIGAFIGAVAAAIGGMHRDRY